MGPCDHGGRAERSARGARVYPRSALWQGRHPAGYLVDSLGEILVVDSTLSLAVFTFVGEVLLIVWLVLWPSGASHPISIAHYPWADDLARSEPGRLTSLSREPLASHVAYGPTKRSKSHRGSVSRGSAARRNRGLGGMPRTATRAVQRVWKPDSAAEWFEGAGLLKP